MTTTGFGRRVPAPQRPGLVLIPDGVAASPAPVVDLASLSELKERIRTVLLSRIDPTVAGRIPRAALRREVAKLVNEIATEDRVQLNKLEEMALAADLSDDMVGLGPLEPLLDDEDTPIFWQTAPLISTSSGMASWKRPWPAFAMRSISPV
jgi:pilus assembly protein CpaF